MERLGPRTPTRTRHRAPNRDLPPLPLRGEADELDARILEKQRELERLTAVRDELLNIYVFGDDDPDARAFDEFYGAYDEVHARIRRFLLG